MGLMNHPEKEFNERGLYEELFAAVRRDFFPRWDRAGRWTLRVEDSPAASWECNVAGKCYLDSCTIIVYASAGLSDRDQRDGLLIHEVCHAHAVAGEGHGNRWQARMAQAARRARRLGRERLARLLEEDAGSYDDS